MNQAKDEERFVEMLKKRQVIVVQCNKSPRNKTYNYKVIGANSSGRWDFTPLVAEYSGYPSNKNATVMYLSVRARDAVALIADTLVAMKKEGVAGIPKESYELLYEDVRHSICMFFIS